VASEIPRNFLSQFAKSVVDNFDKSKKQRQRASSCEILYRYSMTTLHAGIKILKLELKNDAATHRRQKMTLGVLRLTNTHSKMITTWEKGRPLFPVSV
jgi:hypothetical protein